LFHQILATITCGSYEGLDFHKKNVGFLPQIRRRIHPPHQVRCTGTELKNVVYFLLSILKKGKMAEAEMNDEFDEEKYDPVCKIT